MPEVSLNGIEFQIKGSSDAASDSIDKLIGKLGELKTALGEVSSIGNIGVKLSAISDTAEKQASKWDRFKTAIKNVWKGIKGIGFPVGQFAGSIKNFTGKIGGLISSFKRILMYRVVRSIIKEISQALEEGAKNAYIFSKTLGDKTAYIAQRLDQLSSSSHKLGNQMGATWASLLAAIQPIVTQIINIIAKAIEIITQFFALLGGSSTYLKARDYAQDWADTTATGAAHAKEWKNQLMGFDELNRLEEPGSGGGGGGSSNPDYGSMFDEMPIAQGIKDFFNSLKDLFDAEKWKELGQKIGEKINEMINSIDWSAIGAWVGEKINALFTTTYWTLKTINFQNIGAKIAEFLNNALEEIDFTNLGGIIAEKLTMLPDILIGFINNLDFKDVGKAIGDTIKGFFANIADWIDEVDWGELIQSILTGIVDFIKGLDLGELIMAGVNLARAIVDGIGEALAGILITLVEPIEDFFENNEVIDGIVKTISDIFSGIVVTVKAGVQLVKDGWTSVAKWIKDGGLGDAVNKAIGLAKDGWTSVTAWMKDKLGGAVNKAIGLARNGWTSVKKWITDSFLGGAVSVLVTLVRSGWKKVSDWITGRFMGADVQKNVDLKRDGWKSVASWITSSNFLGALSIGISLVRQGWTTVIEWLKQFLGTGATANNIKNSVPNSGIASNSNLMKAAESSVAFAVNGVSVNSFNNSSSDDTEETMYRAFKRALDETDFGNDIELDGQKIYRAMVRRNRMNTAATGVNAFA